MTNEEKAKQIHCDGCIHINRGFDRCKTACSGSKIGVPQLIKMAEWKDEQFSEFLCSIRGSNMWEGREWRFEREWREFKESFDEFSE